MIIILQIFPSSKMFHCNALRNSEGLAIRSNNCTITPSQRQTVDFKLQRKLLQSVGELCERLDLSPSDAEPIAQACIPYLSWEQPKELQAACKGSLGTLCQRDPDGMWLLLAQLQPAEAMVPPHPVLVPYKVRVFMWLFFHFKVDNSNYILKMECKLQ